MAQSVAYYKMGSLSLWVPLFVVLEVEETLAHIKQVLASELHPWPSLKKFHYPITGTPT